MISFHFSAAQIRKIFIETKIENNCNVTSTGRLKRLFFLIASTTNSSNKINLVLPLSLSTPSPPPSYLYSIPILIFHDLSSRIINWIHETIEQTRDKTLTLFAFMFLLTRHLNSHTKVLFWLFYIKGTVRVISSDPLKNGMPDSQRCLA